MATSTLAWGVNTPAHLVIIKGTEYFDAPSRCAPGLCLIWLPHGAADLPVHIGCCFAPR